MKQEHIPSLATLILNDIYSKFNFTLYDYLTCLVDKDRPLYSEAVDLRVGTYYEIYVFGESRSPHEFGIDITT